MNWFSNQSSFLVFWYDLILSYDLLTHIQSLSHFDTTFLSSIPSPALNPNILGIKWCSTTCINHRRQSTSSQKVLFYSPFRIFLFPLISSHLFSDSDLLLFLQSLLLVYLIIYPIISKSVGRKNGNIIMLYRLSRKINSICQFDVNSK